MKGATAGPSATKLGMAQGALMVALWDVGTRVVLVSPSTLKRHATGVGNAPKSAVLDAAVDRLAFEPTKSTLKRLQIQDFDRADALWLAHYGHVGKADNE
jgi:Holliday junction resolvasome RuvABC endonuclease subunit